MDLLKQKKNQRTFPLDGRDEGRRLMREPVDPDSSPEEAGTDPLSDNEDGGTPFAILVRETEEIQAAVRRRVEPKTWEAFWLVGVALWTVEETAHYLGMPHASVYKAKARVTKMLQAEGCRRLVASVGAGSADQTTE